MDHKDLVTFGQMYAQVALARGEVPNAERIQLYFDKLKTFELSEVMSAMEWAMLNLNRFPLLPDLVIRIEGSDEDHANRAWDALKKMLAASEAASFTLCDLVMAKTIQQTWGTVKVAQLDFARPQDDFGRAAVKRDWKVAYTERYKNRDRLRREMTYPAVLEVVSDPQPANDDYELRDYMVDSSYNLSVISRRTIKALPRPARVGIPEDIKEHFNAMLDRMGNTHGRSNWLKPPLKPPRTPVPSPFVRIDTGDVDVERVRKYVQHVKSGSSVPDDGTEGDAADRDATADTGPDEYGERHKSYCTCASVANGGPCNCNGQG